MNKKLKSNTMLAFIVNGMLGIEVIIMPLTAVKYAKTDAWLSPILTSAILLIVLHSAFWLCGRYPGLNFAQISMVVFGKIFGKIAVFISTFYNILYCSISLRLFAETISTFLLENTPIIVVMFIFLASVVYCSVMDIETISIIFNLLLPVILTSVFLVLILSISAADLRNLLPILSEGPMPIIKGSVNIFTPAATSFAFTMIMPYFNEPKKTKKYITRGIIIGALVYSSILAMCLMVLGNIEIEQLIFPTLTLSKALQLEVQVFERTESLFMTAWIPITFTNLVLIYLIVIICEKELLSIKKTIPAALLSFPIILYLALYPKDIYEVFDFLRLTNAFVLGLAFIYMPIIILVELIKKGRKKNAKKT
ncbi:GerAB/ArcD/ProY family transporter [Clostridium thermarum]|uniref:GerAB/ArcD/ProY family transporter n=1 Tax=Clostridium thermarum TaxID=1716543 RepID=UPI0013D066D8|nr:endospore germination permease [Clostridium thermarum]